MCWRDNTWTTGCNGCPSGGAGPFGWVSYMLIVRVLLVLGKLECLRRVRHHCPMNFQRWIGCEGQWGVWAGGTVAYVLPAWWQRCLPNTYAKAWVDGANAGGLGFKLFHEQVGNEGADGGTNGCTMDLFKIFTLEEVGFWGKSPAV